MKNILQILFSSFTTVPRHNKTNVNSSVINRFHFLIVAFSKPEWYSVLQDEILATSFRLRLFPARVRSRTKLVRLRIEFQRAEHRSTAPMIKRDSFKNSKP